MPPAQLDRIEEKVDQILEILGSDSTPDLLAAPTDFQLVLNDDRTVTASWSPIPDQVEVHEFEVDPLDTLKAMMPGFASQRTSSVLEGGHDYTYAVRARRGNQVSEFSERITLYVPSRDELEPDEEPQEPDEDEPGGEEPQQPQPGGPHPSDILDLRNWTIMLPTGTQGDPDNDYIIGRSIPNTFFVRDGAVVFRAPANGVHSPNSKYVRCEARQMNNNDWDKSGWPSSELHVLDIDLAIDASNFETRKRLNGVQIHDGGDDVCQIMRHEDWGLGFMHKDGDEFIPIDANYVDGTRFNCKIEVNNNRLKVWYNGVLVVNITKEGSGWYWKFGCYNQTGGASDYEEPDTAYGEVVVYRYKMTP